MKAPSTSMPIQGRSLTHTTHNIHNTTQHNTRQHKTTHAHAHTAHTRTHALAHAHADAHTHTRTYSTHSTPTHTHAHPRTHNTQPHNHRTQPPHTTTHNHTQPHATTQNDSSALVPLTLARSLRSNFSEGAPSSDDSLNAVVWRVGEDDARHPEGALRALLTEVRQRGARALYCSVTECGGT